MGKKRLKIYAPKLTRLYRFILQAIGSGIGCAGGWDRETQKDWIMQDIMVKKFNRSTDPKPRSNSKPGARSWLSITAKKFDLTYM